MCNNKIGENKFHFKKKKKNKIYLNLIAGKFLINFKNY
jgi:hypothetical protein